jgi:hypothetical protein
MTQNLSQADIDAILDALTDRILNRPSSTLAMANLSQGDSDIRCGPQTPPENPDNQDGTVHISTASKIGVFEPDLSVDECHPAGDIVTVGRDTIYRNVDAFCERIEDAVTSQGSVIVHDNLQTCLHGQAMRWYTHELSAIDKCFMCNDDFATLEQWKVRLRDRFRPGMVEVNCILNHTIVSDILRGSQIPQGNPGTQDGGVQSFTAFKIGFFELDLPIDDRHLAGDVITAGRDLIYRNVNAFCGRIRDAIATEGVETIRDNLQLCLRGAANCWWTFELSEINKKAILNDDSPELLQWTVRLLDRFHVQGSHQDNLPIFFNERTCTPDPRTPLFGQETRPDALTPSVEDFQFHQVYSDTLHVDKKITPQNGKVIDYLLSTACVIPTCGQVLKVGSMDDGTISSCLEDASNIYSRNEHGELPSKFGAQAHVNTPDDITQEYIELKEHLGDVGFTCDTSIHSSFLDEIDSVHSTDVSTLKLLTGCDASTLLTIADSDAVSIPAIPLNHTPKYYIDDVAIMSDGFESHIEHLRTVLRTLSDLGLAFPSDECYIVYHSVQLCGYKVELHEEWEIEEIIAQRYNFKRRKREQCLDCVTIPLFRATKSPLHPNQPIHLSIFQYHHSIASENKNQTLLPSRLHSSFLLEFGVNRSSHLSRSASSMKSLTGIDAPTPPVVASTTAHEIQDDAHDALIFALIKMSIYDDKKHKPVALKPGDEEFIPLVVSMEAGCHLPMAISHKLSPRCVGPSEVIRAAGRLAYELDITRTWRTPSDPFHRPEASLAPLVTDDVGKGHEEGKTEEIIPERSNECRKQMEWLVDLFFLPSIHASLLANTFLSTISNALLATGTLSFL